MFDFFTQVYNHALKRSIVKGAYGNITTFLSFKTLYNKTDVSFFNFPILNERNISYNYTLRFNLCKNWSRDLTVTWYKVKQPKD